ncbi:MAG: hypothetical protein R3Y50_08005 [Rikenellaceae bacterium]
MKPICKITFEDESQKAVIEIEGGETMMESASIEFSPCIDNESSSLAANLATTFMRQLIGIDNQ